MCCNSIMQYNDPEKEIQICPHCGQVVYSAKDLEKRLGTPILFLFEQYEQWKKLQEVAPKDSMVSVKSDSHE